MHPPRLRGKRQRRLRSEHQQQQQRQVRSRPVPFALDSCPKKKDSGQVGAEPITELLVLGHYVEWASGFRRLALRWRRAAVQACDGQRRVEGSLLSHPP